MSRRWLTGDALAFDIESTGVDVFSDRIVTACAVLVGKSGAFFRGRWLLNPGVPIPAGATAVHGITNEKARQDGVAPEHVLPAIHRTLTDAWAEGLPVIIMNAQFDLTMLQAEMRRYEQEPLVIGPVLDSLVIDRALDPYRKGKRTLTSLAQHYGVKQDGAHSSDGDALTAARIIWKQANTCAEAEIAFETVGGEFFRRFGDLTREQMQAFQTQAHAQWAGQFEVWLRQQGRPEVINREWPVRKVA